MDISRLVDARGGVCRTSTLLRVGATRAQIDSALEIGEIFRLRRGVYATHLASHAATAAMHGGRVTCATALRLRGVFVLADHALHIDIGVSGAQHAHAACQCIVHNSDSTTMFGIASVREALVRMAKCAPVEELFAAYESAWHLGLLSKQDRSWVRSKVPAHIRPAIDFACGTSESGLESLLRFRLHHLGIVLQSQVLIPGVGRVDFLCGRTIIEVDGRLGHADPRSRHKDLVRDAEAAALGYRVVRLDYALVVHDWPTAERAILAALAH